MLPTLCSRFVKTPAAWSGFSPPGGLVTRLYIPNNPRALKRCASSRRVCISTEERPGLRPRRVEGGRETGPSVCWAFKRLHANVPAPAHAAHAREGRLFQYITDPPVAPRLSAFALAFIIGCRSRRSGGCSLDNGFNLPIYRARGEDYLYNRGRFAVNHRRGVCGIPNFEFQKRRARAWLKW